MSIDLLRAAVESSIESISNRRDGGGTRAQAEATDAAWAALEQVGRDAARYHWLRSKFARGDLDYTHFATDEQVDCFVDQSMDAEALKSSSRMR